MKTFWRQVAMGAMVLVVVATVLTTAPLANPLACLGLMLVAAGTITEARRRRLAAAAATARR